MKRPSASAIVITVVALACSFFLVRGQVDRSVGYGGTADQGSGRGDWTRFESFATVTTSRQLTPLLSPFATPPGNSLIVGSITASCADTNTSLSYVTVFLADGTGDHVFESAELHGGPGHAAFPGVVVAGNVQQPLSVLTLCIFTNAVDSNAVVSVTANLRAIKL